MKLEGLHNKKTTSTCKVALNALATPDLATQFEELYFGDVFEGWLERDDHIILHTLLSYMSMAGGRGLPFWRIDGVVMTIVLHIGPVEFLYYWFHRALHHHYLYSRYHSHHHSSIVTLSISVLLDSCHPSICRNGSIFYAVWDTIDYKFGDWNSVHGSGGWLFTYIDFMNNMGHCNFELIPNSLFSIFPPLKYLIYTPSFHSLNHTQFRTNYSPFMPFYDYGPHLVLNSIPPGTKQVFLRAKLSKIAHAIAFVLCQTGIQVAVLHEEEHMELQLSNKCGTNLVLTKTNYPHSRIRLVGDGLTEEVQNKASKGTIFIPFSQFPLKKIRQDCFYHTTPAMITPPSLNNLHSCEIN
ncbi:hypothetical protein Q3G72_027949 [Acer saccharum]|nr:hypothetical protein Q3G72_027949 [Acer saccharum]